MKSLPILLGLAVISSSAPAAPIALSPGNFIYTQNFDILAMDANNGVATSTWADDSTIPGWSWYRAGNTVGAPPGLAGAAFTYYVADGTAPPNTAPLAHGFYSVGVVASADRGMGFSPTTGQGELSAIVIFQNATAGAVRLSRVKFTTEAYRANATANNKDSIFVWYKSAPDAASLTTNTIATVASNTKNSNTDRDTDLDGDGQSNYLEFLAGTAANNSSSSLHITNAAISVTNEVSLTWASVAGKRYLAKVSPDLGISTAWAAVGTPVTATGPSTSVPPGLIIPAGFPAYFLRVELVP